MIANQYAAREAGATKVKVVIMDGGTWDTILANDGARYASVTSVASAFGRSPRAGRERRDRRAHHLLPDARAPRHPGRRGAATLAAASLRGQSTVPCHFLDLQPLWAGHPEYTAPGAIPVPTEAGAIVIADAIWAVMQQNCIAQ